ncbi:hypothetical protein C6I20_12125 [Aeromicrobium sp. A1-2]|uniref:sugar transferase n=1 Tax=Aeromicrobium sp. A1-2 TaxID=2107713 RepID=UPI000E5522BA|nr:sugar transferase [Aeromicrobium sp. A1-2]AXT85858.1 hypothetical protein C6I20_12125 [Aeromicrobium sp. A1-2]
MTSVEFGANPGNVSSDGEARLASAIAGVRFPMPRFVDHGALPHALACATAVIGATALAGSAPVVWLAAAAVLCTMALDLAMAPAYERNRSLRPVNRLLTPIGAALLAGSSFAWLTPTQVRQALVVVLSSAVVLACAGLLARLTRPPRSVLVVGGRLGAEQFITQWSVCPEIDVRGVCLPEFVDESAQEIANVPILGSLVDVAGVAIGLGVDEVVVAPGPLLSANDVRRMSWALERSAIELSVAADVHGAGPHRITPRVLGRRLVLSVRPGRRSRPGQWGKAAMDRAGATLLLAVLSPVMLMVSILIRRDSPGPALFTQTRVGFDGKPFTIYKFRTMVVDAEARLAELRLVDEGAGPLFKMAEDPRTTTVGRLLRSTSLDELPQLINVIRGDMSLIGPRPGLPHEVDAYDDWIRRRLRTKPGMTGAWQVGGRSNLSWSDSVRLDLDYVDNATLREDLRIAVRTARVVLNRDGAV